MKDVEKKMIERAKELLNSGEVARVIGWKKGEFIYDPTPAVFESEQELSEMVYNGFCGANLSKYLIEKSKGEGKTAVFLKPCDTYSFNELVKEHRIQREKIYVIGVQCNGNYDVYKLRDLGVSMITGAEEKNGNLSVSTLYGEKQIPLAGGLLERCLTCKGKEHKVFDERIILDEQSERKTLDRFAGVRKIESMTADERFSFWRKELSKCIRCNACRNVCPACSCIKCVFDNPSSGISAKANDTEFEENLFHVIRAFHVAGRCTDCGECSRVCPQRIPLHLLNRKFISDINREYGEFQAGETSDGKHPLISFTENDKEAKDVVERK